MKTVQLDIYDGQILPWQERARDDKHRFKVLVAGRKARKTTFMVNKLVKAAAEDTRGLKYPYLAPFRKQAKKIVWDDHLGRVLRLFDRVGIRYKRNNSELSITFDSGSKFIVDGADNAEALRGESDWGGLGADEYASWRPYIWQEIVRPNLQVHKAWGVIGGTPKGYGNDLYKMAKMGDHNHVIDNKPSELDPDFMTFHATSYDNIFLDPSEVEAAKRQSTTDFFNQEYLAKFTRFTGLVYPEFDIATHVHPVNHVYDERAEYLFGLDFAVRGNTGMIAGYVKSDGHIYFPENAEYKEENRTAQQHATEIRKIIDRIAPFHKFVGYADPSGFSKTQQGIKNGQQMTWSLADEYLENDFPIVPANNEVVPGINYVRQLFKANMIHIDPTNEKTIDELIQYQWREQPEKQVGIKNVPEEVRKFNDHIVDPLRYLAYSKPTAPEEQETSTGLIFPAEFKLKIDEPNESQDHFEPIESPTPFDI